MGGFGDILCQEDAYLLELVRYIHLNPLRAKIVNSLTDTDNYPYSGHSALMGKVKRKFQDIGYVLRLFGKKVPAARRAYRAYVEKGIAQGRRPVLVGGGLIRSAGKHQETVKARSLLCYWALRKLGFSATELSRKLGVSQPSVSISIKRGEKIAKARQLELIKE